MESPCLRLRTRRRKRGGGSADHGAASWVRPGPQRSCFLRSAARGVPQSARGSAGGPRRRWRAPCRARVPDATFAFAKVAALHGLTAVVSTWLAALVLCAVWLALGSALVLALMARAGHVTGLRWWRVFRERLVGEPRRPRAGARGRRAGGTRKPRTVGVCDHGRDRIGFGRGGRRCGGQRPRGRRGHAGDIRGDRRRDRRGPSRRQRRQPDVGCSPGSGSVRVKVATTVLRRGP